MFDLIVYAGGCYAIIGTAGYVIGHPAVAKRYGTTFRKSGAQEPASRQGIIARQFAHAIQMVNFLVYAIAGSRITEYQYPPSISELYTEATRRAFDMSNHFFITTGSPHSRAYYPRNFAWFYPTLLDAATIRDSEDIANRVALLEQSLKTVVISARNTPYTTTLVAFSQKRFAAVNYVTPPSDSLLGVLCGIEQLLGQATPLSPPIRAAVLAGTALLSEYRADLAAQARYLISQLSPATFETASGTVTCPLFDIQKNKSSATDTRRERMRFVVNANIWSTLRKAVSLGIIGSEEVADCIGCDLLSYKEKILDLFGSEGFIRNSVDPNYPAEGIHAITLDFAHVNRGFWDFSSAREAALFKNTVAMITGSDEFTDTSGKCFFVSAENARTGLIHWMTVPSYHGRTVWPALNVEFADRLLDLADATNDADCFARAATTLQQIKRYVASANGYPELLDAHGKPYRTWIYRSAVADSWFPRFASVWYKAFGERLA